MGPAQGVGGNAWKGWQRRGGRLRKYIGLRGAGRGRGGWACAAPAYVALSGSSTHAPAAQSAWAAVKNNGRGQRTTAIAVTRGSAAIEYVERMLCTVPGQGALLCWGHSNSWAVPSARIAPEHHLRAAAQWSRTNGRRKAAADRL